MTTRSTQTPGSFLNPRERVLRQIAAWREDLINLTRSNRLLHYKATKSSSFEILEPSFDEVLERLLGLAPESWSFFAPEQDEDEDGEPLPENLRTPRADNELLTSKDEHRDLLRCLVSLERRTQQEFLDKGLWILYLAAGMLEWRDPLDDSEIASPLVMIPVSLERESIRDPFKLARAQEDIVINPSLAVKLSGEFGIELPDLGLLDETNPRSYLEAVNRIVSRKGWKVSNRLIVSAFSFYKEVIYKDLKDNEDSLADHPIIQLVSSDSVDNNPLHFEAVDPDLLDEIEPPESIVTILDADASQRQCILAARDGKSFVMDGPPGTGKSQTIANMIAQLLADGKTILFVSEKAAALDVVHKRLLEVGISDYVLPLHSHKTRRSEVAQELGKAISRQPKVPTRMSHADLARLREKRIELSQYADAMNEIRSPLERSLHDVLGRLAQLSDIVDAPLPESIDLNLSAAILEGIVSLAERLARNWGPIAHYEDFVWRGYRGKRFDAKERLEVSGRVRTARLLLDQLELLVESISMDLRIGSKDRVEGSHALLRILDRLRVRPPIPPHWLVDSSLAEIEDLMSLLQQATAGRIEAISRLHGVFGDKLTELQPEWSAVLSEHLEALESLSPRLSLSESKSPEKLQTLNRALVDSTAFLGKVRHETRTICKVFGIESGQLTLVRAAELGELASLTTKANRPESEWFKPMVLEAVREGAAVLKERLEEHRRLRDQLKSIFREEALELDLHGISTRFAYIHKGPLKWFTGSYWSDRTALKSVAVRGKVDNVILKNLPAALAWQRAEHALSQSEERYRASLGRLYPDRDRAEFAAIQEAIELVDRALDIAQEQLSMDAIENLLSIDACPDANLSRMCKTLPQQIDASVEEHQVLYELYPDLKHAMLRDVESWTCQVVGHLEVAAEIANAVDSITDQRSLRLSEIGALLKDAEAVSRSDQLMEKRFSEASELLGPRFLGFDTAWEELTEDIQWTESFRCLIDAPWDLEAAENLLSSEVESQELRDCLESWTESVNALISLFEQPEGIELAEELASTFNDARELLSRLDHSQEDIPEWIEFCRVGQDLKEKGLGGALEYCISRRLKGEEIPGIIEKATLNRWVDAVLEKEEGRLDNLRSEDRELLVATFQELDRKLVERSSARVIEACNGRRPITGIGIAGIILNEAQKKRKHMPVRDLLNKCWDIVQAVKPCFMMSPLTVSQFLPSRSCFDVVIFDEASQVRPSDSVNAIYRGQQLIVAGDQKQLPPTSFFDAVIDDGSDTYEEGELSDFESILDLCKGGGGLNSLPLRWHYRSRHEDLITFSNYRFYGGELITFPGSLENSEDLGVDAFLVPDGVYRRGAGRDNPKEAEKVVERVLDHAYKHPSQSLGVVAFSAAQADAIETRLEMALQSHPHLDGFFAQDRLDGFFVKNLENVQGDERDTIILSVGYARDEAGKFTLQLGPLSQQNGHRRLNVAITRARKRVEVVSSVTHADFAGQMTHAGVRHLKSYLQYAERGPKALAMEVEETGRDVESPFEAEVASVIREWGYDVVPQVGAAGYRIDLAVRHPEHSGQFALGIECDGTMYHSSRVARDRDRLRQGVLEGLGWKLHRIWGFAWYRERSSQEERLRNAIVKATTTGVVSEPSKPDRNARATIEYEFPEFDEVPDWVITYKLTTLQLPRSKGEIYAVESRITVQDAIQQVALTEGPVATEVLIRRVREAWGYGRTSTNIRGAIEQALKVLVARKALKCDREGFVWCRDDIAEVRSPDPERPETQRSVGEVSSEELTLGITRLVEDAVAITQEELTTKVARIFGWARRGPEISQKLDRLVARLLREKKLARNGEFLKVSG